MEHSNTDHQGYDFPESSTNLIEYDIVAGPETPPLKPIRDVVNEITFMEGELRDIRKNVQIIKNRDPDLPREHRAVEKEVRDLSASMTVRGLSKYLREQNNKFEHAKSDLGCNEWLQYEAWRTGVAVVPTIDWQELGTDNSEPLPYSDVLGLYTVHATATRVVFEDPSITLEDTYRLFHSQDDTATRVLPLIQAVFIIHAHLGSIDKTHNEHLEAAAQASQATEPVTKKFDTFIERYESAYDAHEAYLRTLKKRKLRAKGWRASNYQECHGYR